MELIGKDAPPIPSYNVLEGNAGDTQTAKRRTPKCSVLHSHVYMLQDADHKKDCAFITKTVMLQKVLVFVVVL